MKPVSFLALGALALCLTGPASAEPAAADDAALLATAKQLTEAAKTDDEARALLRYFGMPFRK